MKKRLVVLAAGMGSRYGGLKQMDPVGPSGEFILDYSVYDAVNSGFDEVVFVIRRDIEEDFRRIVGQRWEERIPVHYVFQAVNDLPAGFKAPAERVKPWGTGHALLTAHEVIDGPFAVVNADDFYGKDAFQSLGVWLDSTASLPAAYAMVAYEVGRTLSNHGPVSRGVCTIDDEDYLVQMVEETEIERGPDGLIRAGRQILEETSPVSLNLFGFKPDFMQRLEKAFAVFLQDFATDSKAEFFIPSVVGSLTSGGLATLKVLRTDSPWIGVTNASDRSRAVAFLADQARSGNYPADLFGT